MQAGFAARAILDAAGMFDVQFYRQKPGGLCYDYSSAEDIEAQNIVHIIPLTQDICDIREKNRFDVVGAVRANTKV